MSQIWINRIKYNIEHVAWLIDLRRFSIIKHERKKRWLKVNALYRKSTIMCQVQHTWRVSRESSRHASYRQKEQLKKSDNVSPRCVRRRLTGSALHIMRAQRTHKKREKIWTLLYCGVVCNIYAKAFHSACLQTVLILRFHNPAARTCVIRARLFSHAQKRQ